MKNVIPIGKKGKANKTKPFFNHNMSYNDTHNIIGSKIYLRL